VGMVPVLNDGSNEPHALRVYINMGNVDTLPTYSAGPHGSTEARLRAIHAAGFQGVQGEHPALCRDIGLACAAIGRFNTPADVLPAVKKMRADGFECVTVHAGWGHESDAEIDALVGEIVAVGKGENFPIFVETHRATLTQDTWRTVKMVEHHPDVRFNCDFSHWYTGLEMPYGD
jgi:hypothetical protein